MKSQQKLEVLHSYVCGPFEVKLLRDNYYLLTLIDEFTRHLWIYLLEKKSEVFSNFKKFKLLVENHDGHNIKRLRTDGGHDYT